MQLTTEDASEKERKKRNCTESSKKTNLKSNLFKTLKEKKRGPSPDLSYYHNTPLSVLQQTIFLLGFQ